MDPAQFVTAPPLTIVAGKGGVGKTTVTATLALAACRAGKSALIVEVEGKSGLPALFGSSELDYQETLLLPADPTSGRAELRARTLTPDTALVEYLRDHGLKRVSNRLAQSGAVDMIATATPGIKDVLILGKVKQLQRNGAADVIILDAPAAGHAISFLRSARGLLGAVTMGPIESQAREVVDLLTDASRCQVLLVTLPEETPVNEIVETAFALEDEVGVALGPVVVNGRYQSRPGLMVDPHSAITRAGVDVSVELAADLSTVVGFHEGRRHLQDEQVRRLAEALPLPQLVLPQLFTAQMGFAELEHLADELTADIVDLPAATS